MSRILRLLDENIRVLPVLILAAASLVFLKSADIWDRVQEELAPIAPARAEGGPTRASNEPSHAEANAAHGEEETSDDTSWVSDTRNTYYDEAGIGLSLAEVQVLESLSARREALDARENDLVMRERLIEAAERRVDERIDDLRALEARIEDLLLLRDEEEEAQMASLVSVYENMRAKDAAAIFDTLD